MRKIKLIRKTEIENDPLFRTCLVLPEIRANGIKINIL